MVDSISSITNALLSQRAQAAQANNAVRAVNTLNAVAQKSSGRSVATQGTGSSQKPVKVFSVQTADNGTSTKVPRGSLVDELV